MSKLPEHPIDNRWILAARGSKNPVDPWKPYGYLSEHERTLSGRIEQGHTVFLSNSECPFRCLMCDLWKNTTDQPVPPGAIPAQIKYALDHLREEATYIKLYNSGSFFDPRAIPPGDYEAIGRLLTPYETVIVESHPLFINDQVLQFRDLLPGKLQVAIGLETVHPEVLPLLNKRMTTNLFKTAIRYLRDHGIETRAFILLRPPFLDEEEGIHWACKSIDFAFDSGVQICTVIPVREGNGALEKLKKENLFARPKIRSLEKVLKYGLSLNRGLVFADLWDLEQFSECDKCLDAMKKNLTEMNLSQEILPDIQCSC